MREYCASSVFVKTLILKGYGFDDASFQHISFQKQVIHHHSSKKTTKKQTLQIIYRGIFFRLLQAGDTSVGWALGYMLTLSNLLPAESAGIRKSLSTGVWGMLIFLFVAFLVVVLAFIFFRTRDWKKGREESTI